MKKLDFLKYGKAFLKNVISYRRNLIRIEASHISKEWATQEMNNIEYAVEAITNYERLARYILRKKETLEILIPVNKLVRMTELKIFITEAEKIMKHESITL